MLSKALANLLVSDLASGTYNLVERNIKVIDILDVLKELIPGLEFLFINQHLRLNALHVKPNPVVNQALGIGQPRSLKDELEEFIAKFSF
jgi:UDP-glucose 4-epimerase